MKKLLIVLILFFSYASYSQSVEKFVKKGMEKLEKLDFKGAIKDYTKAIELAAPNYVQPNIIDYQEKDYYEYAAAYYNRGRAKRSLEDYKGAIADYTKAIELDSDDANAYFYRGDAKEMLGDFNGACEDWKIAVSLGNEEAKKWVANQCN